MATIGFIGLGIMGTPMARHLQDAGHTVVTSKFHIPPKQELIDNGLQFAETPKALAEKVDITILMLPDTPDVKDVLFGENGVASGLSAGKLLIDMSSISPIDTKEFAKKVRETGAEYMDAPVSGGEVGAKDASLSIMAGGTEGRFERGFAAVQADGQEHHAGRRLRRRAGDQGRQPDHRRADHRGCRGGTGVCIEGGRGSGPGARSPDGPALPPPVFWKCNGDRMVKRTFDPGFRISLHQKDLNLALQGAKAIGVSLPNTAATQELFNSCACPWRCRA